MSDEDKIARIHAEEEARLKHESQFKHLSVKELNIEMQKQNENPEKNNPLLEVNYG